MNYVYTGLMLAGIFAGLGTASMTQAAPVAGAVDTAGGYGLQVLEKVLPLWQTQAGTNAFMVVSVRVGSNGEILYCDTRKSSGNPLTDTGACSIVARAGSFAPPASGMPVEIFLTLPLSGYAANAGQGQSYVPQQPQQAAVVPGWTDPGIGPRGQQGQNMGQSLGQAPGQNMGQAPGQAQDLFQGQQQGLFQGQTPAQTLGQPVVEGSGSETQPAYSSPGSIHDASGIAPVAGNYANIAMSLIQPHVRVPREFKGEAHVVIRLGVAANGQVTAMDLEETTGSSPAVNEAVFQAIRKAGTLPAPGVAKLMLLTFTLRGL